MRENTCFFFYIFSTIKVNNVDKIMQSAYLCVIFHVRHKKLTFLAVLTLFLIGIFEFAMTAELKK